MKEMEKNMATQNFGNAIKVDDFNGSPGRSLVAPTQIKLRSHILLAKRKVPLDAAQWADTYSLSLLAARQAAAAVNDSPSDYVWSFDVIDGVYLKKVAQWFSWRTLKVFKELGSDTLKDMFTNLKAYEIMKEQEDL
ncbi:hypothetical protein HDU93_003702 [Gonapodya sp. JEL0774]|nr:hypothetical protein HDU93_003702 [Gonapodya sp. JEL0774]